MNSYLDTLDACLRDWKRCLVGVVLNAIPIANIFFLGYLLRIINQEESEEFSLPAWEGWGGLFVDGFRVLLCCLVWALPFVLILLLGTFFMDSITLFWILLITLFFLVFFYLIPAIIVLEARQKWGSLGAGTLGFCFHADYALHWFLILVLGFFFSGLSYFLEQFIGIFALVGLFASAILLIIMARVFSEMASS